MIRREKFGEVALLITRVNSMEGRRVTSGETTKILKKNETARVDKKGAIHIRREATNNNWY